MSLMQFVHLSSKVKRTNLTSNYFKSVLPFYRFIRLDLQLVTELFMVFNTSGDGSMSMQEFVYCWNGWITKVGLGSQ